MTGHELAARYATTGVRARSRPHALEYRTPEEAEAVLEQLARVLAPANTEMQKPASTLSEKPGVPANGTADGNDISQTEW